ncbi:DUF4421 domain-containing protein [Treponema sp. OttesenSCG-928-L16]|nr:DUF4421 domain-containing protein [Treponema sp. OttesenSCG-928-L16]
MERRLFRKPFCETLFLIPVFCLFLAAGLYAAEEAPPSSGNILIFDEAFTVNVSGRYSIVSFADRMNTNYESQTPWALGLGLRYKILSASFSLPLYKISGRKPFSTFDFEMNSYPGPFYYSLFCRRYRGFYQDADEQDVLDVDLRLFSAGISGAWVVNSEGHSLGAAYNLSGRQKASSGSALFGFGVFYTSVHSPDGRAEHYREKQHFVYFGPSAGYSHTFVFPHNMFLNLMAAAEMNAGFKTGSRTWHFMPQLMPRISFGYHHDSWSLNLVGNCRYLLILRKADRPDGLLMSSMAITFSYRF